MTGPRKRKKRKPGPKPNPEKARTSSVRVRLNRAEDRLIREAASRAGESKAAYMRKRALGADED